MAELKNISLNRVLSFIDRVFHPKKYFQRNVDIPASQPQIVEVKAVHGFIVDKDHRLLVVQRSRTDKHMPLLWELPGGRLKTLEEKKKGLLREIKEETGLHVHIHDLMRVDQYRREDGEHIKLFTYLCTPVGNKVKLSTEHVDFDWVDLAKDPVKIGEYYLPDVKWYRERFLKD